jgi:hypothetical protein
MKSLGQCYILKLENGKWYVGWTEDPIKRLQKHKKGTGSEWTKLHPVVGNYFYLSLPGKTKSQYPYRNGLGENDEDEYTLRMMGKHGLENVRGGSWPGRELPKNRIGELLALIGKFALPEMPPPAPAPVPPPEDSIIIEEVSPQFVPEPELLEVTAEFVRSGKSRNGGWSKAQLKCLGVSWAPMKGDITSSYGAFISESDYDEFLRLKDKHL